MIIKGKILFHSCIQDAQDYGSNDEFMVSRLLFSLQLPDKRIDNLYADIKQSVGENYEEGPLEVTWPKGLKEQIDYSIFRDAAESYYRTLVGKQGHGIKIVGSTNVRMRDCVFEIPATYDIDIDTEKGAW